MTVGGHRSERVAEEIHHEMNLMLAGELADPRLAAAVSVSEVRMTPDMRTVRVFVQLEGDDAARDRAMEGLKAASGFVRHELTERLHLRRSPEVLFIPDTSEEYGHRIDDLLKKLKDQ
jgi:ribosome-binding factor A